LIPPDLAVKFLASHECLNEPIKVQFQICLFSFSYTVPFLVGLCSIVAQPCLTGSLSVFSFSFPRWFVSPFWFLFVAFFFFFFPSGPRCYSSKPNQAPGDSRAPPARMRDYFLSLLAILPDRRLFCFFTRTARAIPLIRSETLQPPALRDGLDEFTGSCSGMHSFSYFQNEVFRLFSCRFRIKYLLNDRIRDFPSWFSARHQDLTFSRRSFLCRRLVSFFHSLVFL